MAGAAAVALLWANLMPHSYESVVHAEIGGLSVAHWASDGLLTIFFFVAGMELKREFVEGSLRKPISALVPVVAAICGMVLPAVIYLAVNVVGHGHLHGWAIPMATDIAFALAVLAIVGSQMPRNLRAFLLTLAIVDDLGAIIIIAVFFTTAIAWAWFAGAIACCLLWWLLQRRQVSRWYVYAPIALVCWWCTLQSGIHATISGVALGMLVWASLEDENDILDRWEHALRPLSAGFAVPVFAVCSAGVHVTGETLHAMLTNPVPLGIVLGLFFGKLLGVFLGAFATAKITQHEPRGGARWREVLGAAQLAGIGFTVSLLLVELAFRGQEDLLAEGKVAVLTASLASALVGGAALRRRNKKRVAASRRAVATAHEPAPER